MPRRRFERDKGRQRRDGAAWTGEIITFSHQPDE
jgi:hypothetical protein